ncbi:MAG: IPT/TIG domain-containing protein [Calditrichia bacterium]|jgi:sugar lactone lactonase YvrE|nr:IPT/TIG domain-containing protein [Calditrichia bacterium]
MKIKRLIFLFFAFLLIVSITSCEKSVTEVPDPYPPTAATPELTSLTPDTAYGGAPITIFGQNFNPNPAKNNVVFDQSSFIPDSATETILVLDVPKLAYMEYTTTKVKVSVVGGLNWSNELDFTYPPVLEVINDNTSWPKGAALDDDGNIYFGSAGDGAIYRVPAPGAEKELFASVAVNGAIEFGPDNYLYVCTGDRIVRISPDGNTIEDVVSVPSPIDFDWDANDNMYIVSNWYGVYRYDTQGDTSTVAVIPASPKSCRVFGNYLYVGDVWGNNKVDPPIPNRLLRYDITASGLENEAVLLEGVSPLGLDIDAEGTIYYSSGNGGDVIYTLAQDGTEGSIFEGQLMWIRFMTFHGQKIYMVYPGWGGTGKVMSAYLGVDQAPNYGRD